MNYMIDIINIQLIKNMQLIRNVISKDLETDLLLISEMNLYKLAYIDIALKYKKHLNFIDFSYASVILSIVDDKHEEFVNNITTLSDLVNNFSKEFGKIFIKILKIWIFLEHDLETENIRSYHPRNIHIIRRRYRYRLLNYGIYPLMLSEKLERFRKILNHSVKNIIKLYKPQCYVILDVFNDCQSVVATYNMYQKFQHLKL
ncbi:uncharacterized protein LOC111638718 [Centruroides sculpturatus]|uniref:uncharacterized protein LOC111638718 n=1 Tax=Centruroides sculpturatus TaxID=218467 RepID=UPI000C6DFA57|nr:uncharacterized protein LOC111638718 [Centruroides sculpturatus]